MAWNYVNGSTIWKYDDTATASDTYSDTVGSANEYNAGIRTFTFANGNTRKTYVKCRTEADLVERGELSWDFYN